MKREGFQCEKLEFFLFCIKCVVGANSSVLDQKSKTNKRIIGGQIMSYLSQEGYDKLKAEIKELEEIERPKVIRQIQEAREKGDLSENAEYDAAKEAQGKLESKIARKKMELANAKILDLSKIKTDVVQILSKVDIEEQGTGKHFTYTLVSDSEVNLREGKISVNTPIARGLIGKHVGDVADIITPVGQKKMKILNISVG